jgi:hypothetical protein
MSAMSMSLDVVGQQDTVMGGLPVKYWKQAPLSQIFRKRQRRKRDVVEMGVFRADVVDRIRNSTLNLLNCRYLLRGKPRGTGRSRAAGGIANGAGALSRVIRLYNQRTGSSRYRISIGWYRRMLNGSS